VGGSLAASRKCEISASPVAAGELSRPPERERERWGVARKEKEGKTNWYVCDKWQVGNFWTQKKMKVRGEAVKVLSNSLRAKVVFGCDFRLGCLLLTKTCKSLIKITQRGASTPTMTRAE
jgi:hypothetical protein